MTDEINIMKKCPFCGDVSAVKCSRQEYNNWKGGMLIQSAMPTLSADDREALMTGICSYCFPRGENND